MYCICKGVTDHRIRESVEGGARSWREVQSETGCGTQCGKCACVGTSRVKPSSTRCRPPWTIRLRGVMPHAYMANRRGLQHR
ncbi:hypothetical protein DSL92_03245 [Billgrantia gudaonensis]|uniref:Bacterioferritin-associated ferredoxin n=1 Tax=Billgrantia gudaonensis TaxID=376427 RepID=A0A432JJT9_9GAMM|nr:hypothetical protein DSL92_03245 [Halomonas gudaonensis]